MEIPNPKLVSLEELEERVKKWKEEGKRIVFANGIFDLLHVGHVRYLKAAKKEGDILIVGINDDEASRQLKGFPRPLLSAKDRALLVASLECVDYVFIYAGENFQIPLKKLKPHIHAKGTDYTPETVPEKEVVASYGGEIRIVGDEKRHSSSEIIRKIKR